MAAKVSHLLVHRFDVKFKVTIAGVKFLANRTFDFGLCSLVSCLDMLSNITLVGKQLGTNWTLEVFHFFVNAFHVDRKTIFRRKRFAAKRATNLVQGMNLLDVVEEVALALEGLAAD